MIEVADVFRRFAADYLSAHGASMLPSHRRAIEDILNCRTAALGGQVWRCEACDTEMFSWHSCGNRSCPKCHTAQTQEWLEHRRAEMLPVPYFHITITVPEELREVLRANQRDGYGVLMRASAAAIIELARDPRYVGGTVGVLAVLHTWTQQLTLHPHVHCLVSGGGISEDARAWLPARRKFLVPIKALAKLVRGKFRAMLRQTARWPISPPGMCIAPSYSAAANTRTASRRSSAWSPTSWAKSPMAPPVVCSSSPTTGRPIAAGENCPTTSQMAKHRPGSHADPCQLAQPDRGLLLHRSAQAPHAKRLR